MRTLEQINKEILGAKNEATKFLLLNEKHMLLERKGAKEIKGKSYDTSKKFNDYSLVELNEIYKNDRNFYEALVKESNKPFEEAQKKVDAKKLTTFAKELEEKESK